MSSIGKTTGSSKSQFSFFNKLGQHNNDDQKKMLEAKWNQFKDTSNIFDEVDNSSNESTSSNEGVQEKKFEMSKSAE